MGAKGEVKQHVESCLLSLDIWHLSYFILFYTLFFKWDENLLNGH